MFWKSQNLHTTTTTNRTATLSDYYNDNVWAMVDLLEDVGIAIEDAVRNKKK